MLARALLASKSTQPAYIEDVFSTWLYTGNGSTQTITNGINLAGKGGLTIFKGRSGATDWAVYDTTRGATFDLATNTTAAQTTQSTGLTAFNTNGFSIGALAKINTSGATYASWTFAEQNRFFRELTVSHTNGTPTNISLSALETVGYVHAKITGTTGDWIVWHRSLTAGNNLRLNTTAAQSTTDAWLSVSGTTATLSGSAPTGTYVIHAFAHNAGGFGLSGADNVISCGSYAGNGSSSGTTVTLNYEPQWLLIKCSNSTSDWHLIDNMRGFVVGGNDAELNPNLSNAESTGTFVTPTATGFQLNTTDVGYNASGGTYIYIAIRRGPMQVPTDATKVYDATAYTGNATTDTTVAGSAPFPVDMVNLSDRDATSLSWTTNYAHYISNRLIGSNRTLSTAFTNAEDGGWSEYHSYSAPSSIGNWGLYGTSSNTDYFNKSGTKYIARKFRRAPGFFDVVCFTSNGSGGSGTQTHNLAAVPELAIFKARDSTSNWSVFSPLLTSSFYRLVLNTTDAQANTSVSASLTSINFNLGNGLLNFASTHVALLFASCPGVSKVGSYTGTGTTLAINCGFTGGARFVLIKRTDSTGDWHIWDTARGIVSGNDPYLLLNSTAAEVTTTDWVDTLSTGFELSNAGGNLVNINGATYIYLAIA